MAKQTSIVTFKGKLDNIVGYKNYGTMALRKLVKPHDTKSIKQVQVRVKFAMFASFASRIIGFINGPFKNSQMPPLALFIKTNYEDGIGGSYPDFELLYNKMKVSRGNIDLPYSPSALIDSQTVNVSWTDNSGIGKALSDDAAMILVYNSAKGQAVYTLNAGNRQERQATLSLPTAWNGDSVDIWMAMKGMSGNNIGTYSVSAYLGNYSI